MKSLSTSEKNIERLILYRRHLLSFQRSDVSNIFSHQLANLMGTTSAQVRRDLMSIGYFGSPSKGYNILSLIESISIFIDSDSKQSVALAGVGNIGRAILDYFKGRREKLDITALFDIDPEKTDRVLHGCRCYPLDQIEDIISTEKINVGIITVPAESAQIVAERMVSAGVTGILNYAPVKLILPHEVYVENRDMILAIEKVAYFARNTGKIT